MGEQMVLPEVLDACCGPRMMWFDRKDPRALYIDKRAELHLIDPTKSRPGRRPRRIEIAPDIVCSFTEMPFPDGRFQMVVFDPPHMSEQMAGGPKGQFRKFYSALPNDWKEVLRLGFAECFRVLGPGGVLIFKWAEISYPPEHSSTIDQASPTVWAPYREEYSLVRVHEKCVSIYQGTKS